jgi:hypothetical protein
MASDAPGLSAEPAMNVALARESRHAGSHFLLS